jgi:ferredoxin
MINTTNKSKIIYYFSGTGNSYYVAKTIRDNIGAILKPFVSLKKGDIIEAEILCFVFPVYDFKPPKKLTEIIENLSKISADYTVAIATYGVALSSTLEHFKKTLKTKGVTLSVGFGIKSPHNAVGSIGFTDEEYTKRLITADKKICDIVLDIQKRTVGKIEKTTIFEDMTIIRQFPHILKFLAILLFRGTRSLDFTVSEDCVSCYRCITICPIDNIQWLDGKPVFGKDCVSCFACLQWCPKSAIHIGKYSFKEICMKHYHHPKVKAEDLFLNGKPD